MFARERILSNVNSVSNKYQEISMNSRLYKPATSVAPVKIKPEGLLCVVKTLDRLIGDKDSIFGV